MTDSNNATKTVGNNNNSNSINLIWGGLGASLLPLVTFATTFMSDQTTPMPLPGFWLAIAIFFVAGIAGAKIFTDSKKAKEAFFAGICAPAFITSGAAGITENSQGNTFNDPNMALNINGFFISSAYAQEDANTPSEIPVPASDSIFNSILKLNLIQSKRISIAQQELVKVYAITPENKKAYMATVSTTGTFEYAIPQGTNKVAIYNKSGKEIYELEMLNGLVNNVDVKVNVAPKNDFWWALGMSRKGIVKGVQVDEESMAKRGVVANIEE